jgi:glycosyltransferase involved in cell wall biosynthesis
VLASVPRVGYGGAHAGSAARFVLPGPSALSAPADAARLPRIALVTPCLNMAPWVEETLNSIHGQGYPALEHVVMDGGSTDGTLEILERWKPRLAGVHVGPDSGLYDAVNKGFAHTSGEIMAWLGADDLLLPGALRTVGTVFATFPSVEWITARHQVVYVGGGHSIVGNDHHGFGRKAFLRAQYLLGGTWPASTFIQAESSFWRRSLWERAGGRLSTEHGPAGDFELWARFFEHAQVAGINALLGAFRVRAGQTSRAHGDRYLEECLRVLREHSGGPPGPLVRYVLRHRRPFKALRKLLRVVLGLRENVPKLSWDWPTSQWRLKRVNL